MYSINDLAVPKSPFLDTQTNRPTREWLMYLLQLGRQPVYGAFASTTNQTLSAASTPARVIFDTVDTANQIYYTSGDGIHLQQDGVYNVQFSVQITNDDTSTHDAYVWFRLNGVDISNSASFFSVVAKHGGVAGYGLLAANFFFTLTAGDYIEMWWAADSTQVTLATLPATTSPLVKPESPSVVVTLQKVNL